MSGSHFANPFRPMTLISGFRISALELFELADGLRRITSEPSFGVQDGEAVEDAIKESLIQRETESFVRGTSLIRLIQNRRAAVSL
jgi:hypothetical protein